MKRTPFSRRDFLQATAGAFGTAFAVSTLGCAQREDMPQTAAPQAAAVSIPIGVQLYCFRHLLEDDFEGTLAKVAELGYDGVEFAGYYDRSAADLRKLMDMHGFQVAGAHIGLDTLLGDELQRSIDFHGELGNNRLIVASMPEDRVQSKETIIRTADTFNEISEKLKPHGMRTGYHCHAYSFSTTFDGESVWDILADNTSDDFMLQLDTGNASDGGAVIPDVIRRHPGRINSMHVKPYLAGAEHPFAAFIGDDGLDWPLIFELSESIGGIEWYVIEYEEEGIPPLEALKANLERVRSMRA